MRCLRCGGDCVVSGGAKPGESRFHWQWDWVCACGFHWDGEYYHGWLTYGFGTATEVAKNQVMVSEGLMAVFGEVAS